MGTVILCMDVYLYLNSLGAYILKKTNPHFTHFFPTTPPYFSGCGSLQIVPEGELHIIGLMTHVGVCIYKSMN